MADVTEKWRSERVTAALYDAGVKHASIARVGAWAMWGADLRPMFTDIARLADLPVGASVLDIPCGGGLAFRGLSTRQAVHYVAADISPYMLQRARREAGRRGVQDAIEFVEADVTALQFADASFDLCVTYNGLHCLPDPRAALAELVRVLRPGGTLRGTSCVTGGGPRKDALIAMSRRAGVFGNPPHTGQIEKWLKELGLDRDTRAQRSGRVLRGTVAVSKGGLMGDRVVGAHTDLHSDQGARQGEHPGRSRDPIIKVHDIAWLEFEKPDLVRAEAFSRAFGFSTVVRTADELYLRGTDAGSPCVLIQRGPRSRFVAAAYTAQDQSDVLRLADATGTRMRALPESLGGVAVDLVDPSGVTVRVVHGTHQLEPCRRRPRSSTTLGTNCGGSTPPNARRASRHGSSGSDIWCCRPPSTGRRSTGTSITSG